VLSTAIGGFIDSWRVGRVVMLALVTASTAFGLGASPGRSALTGLLGALLSLGGFLLDDYLDRHRDPRGSRNPLVSGRAGPRAVLAVSVCAFVGSAALSLWMDPWVLLPVAAVAAVLVLPSTGIASGPLARAVVLGVLQALYAVIGGVSAGPGRGAQGLLCLSLFLFFGMAGGRVMGDVRDMPADTVSGVRTIPLVFGMPFALAFLVVNEILAYGCGIAAWLVGGLGGGYLACMLAICVLGSSINVFFLTSPTPRRADLTNRLSLGLLGGLYTAGMVSAGLRLW
jgi:4-hydroxybenzoate polyprenyltransferase